MDLSQLKAIGDDFRNLNPKDIGSWPVAPRIATLVAIFVALLVAGWYFLWRDQLLDLEKRRAEEVQLKEQFVSKKKLAVNLDLYQQQLNEIDLSFGALLKQLPNRTEVDALLVEVNQAGLGRGLQFELFRPGAEGKRDFYAELPVSIKVTGSYHDLGAFAADVGRMSRIVTLNNISITPLSGDTLAMDAMAKTFRYLDPEEVAAQRRTQTAGGKRQTKR